MRYFALGFLLSFGFIFLGVYLGGKFLVRELIRDL